MPLRDVVNLLCCLAFLAPGATASAQQGKRPLVVDDLYQLREVRDPQRSPDGKWVAYTVTRAIRDTDKNDTDVWMTSWDGKEHVQLTSTPENETVPRWSPDGKYLAFLAARQGSKRKQVWLLNRAGGEAVKVTDAKGAISDLAWSPDSKQLALVIQDPDPSDPDPDKEDKRPDGTAKPAKPIVINRYYFKADGDGYLRGERTHIYLFDIASKKTIPLTSGNFDEESPSWSPDGTRIAFIRRHGEGDVDRAPNKDLFVITSCGCGVPVRLTTTTAEETGRPVWSPDGKTIAYLLGEELKWYAYDQPQLMVIPADGGEPRALTASLDRPVSSPVWLPDGEGLTFTVVDDRSQHVARVSLSDARVERLTEGRRVVDDPSGGKDGGLAVLASTASEAPEVHAFENGRLRKLTSHNDEWMSELLLGATEEFTSTSKDGTEVHGLILKPPTYRAGEKYPTLLRIHGGPNGQDEHSFSFERHLFAANGYVVVAVNYRGSNGRGSAFQKAIHAEWGNKEVVDLLGAMDHVQKMGLADPERLGIGGWSYGGILTNYTIATDGRFKAAISGAGSSNQISMYGTDMYIQQYEHELGAPWKNPEAWMKVSYPFFHADRIRTPTLFMCGEKDFNVPLLGSEQMYQALKSLGVDSELVIYPGEYHGITVPSYRKDRFERYLAWYDKYLKKASPPQSRPDSPR
jgi:dipeptidyl aminopeptidase/acylaminoacyl peptidase